MIDHPDDAAARRHLAQQIRTARHRVGMTQQRLADLLGVTYGAVSDFETRQGGSWQTQTVLAAARALGRRLTFTIDGLTVPDYRYTRTDLLRLARPPVDPDVLAVRMLVEDLRQVRIHQGMTLVELGRLLGGIGESAAHRRERAAEGTLIRSLQQHTRALGGVLRLGLNYAAAGVAA